MATPESIMEKYADCTNKAAVGGYCTCTSEKCPRRLQCCACVEFHRDHSGTPLPHCLRNLEHVQWQKRDA